MIIIIYTFNSFAVKRLKESFMPEPEFLNSKDMREAKIYSELLKHENIVKCEDTFFDQFSYFYLVLEFCDGGSLYKKIEDNIKANTKFSNESILKWAKGMILGIKFLHSHKIIHRDIKPA